MKDLKASIIIVNFNTGEYLRNCIEGILKGNTDILEKIVIVDNNSSDNSLQSIKSFSDKLLVVKNNLNLGFAKACNIGAQKCNSEFLIFLNPDTIVDIQQLQKTLKFIEENPQKKIGVCGVRQINEYGETSRHCCKHPNILNFISLSIGLHKILKNSSHVMEAWNHDSSRNVEHVIGSCYFIRNKIFKELNGFDERFYLYYEDLDLSTRVRLAGWNIYYYADAKIQHFCGGSSRNVVDIRLFRSIQSKIIFIDKYYGPLQGFFLFLVSITFEFFIRTTLSILKLDISEAKNVFSGFILLITWSRSFFLKK
jgi:GT2 family glycosyltransferase